MATTFLEPGGDATFNANDITTGGIWGVSSNGPTVVTDFVHGGHIKSIKSGGAGAAQQVHTATGTVADAGTRLSFWIYLVTLPTSTALFFSTQSSSGGDRVGLALTSTGILQARYNGSQIGTNGPTLSTGQWYRISISYVLTSSTVNQTNVWVNGTSAIAVTNANMTFLATSWAMFGNYKGDATLELRYSDFYIDNSSALTDPGNIWVTAKRPFANGTSNQWTTQIGSGGSGYGSGHSSQVNERPLSNTNGWSIQNASKQTEEYTIESKSQGDINIQGASIIDFMGWVDCKVGVNSTGNIIVAGVATNISVTTSETVFTQAAGSTTYPTGNTDIGMDTNTVNQLFSLYECGIMVAYIPKPFSPFPSHYRS